MTNLQIEHLVERWEDRRDVKNQMGKFMHYLLLKKEAAIVDDLWSTRDDICYGVNGGWYVGQAQVRDYFGWFPGYTAKVAQCLRAKFPEKFEGKNDDEIFGIGLLELKSISNYVIEVAEDGEGFLLHLWLQHHRGYSRPRIQLDLRHHLHGLRL